MREYTNSEIQKAIDEFIHSERNRQILKRRFIDGKTYEGLAEEYDMSVAQVKRIIYKYGDYIILKISAEGGKNDDN